VLGLEGARTFDESDRWRIAFSLDPSLDGLDIEMLAMQNVGCSGYDSYLSNRLDAGSFFGEPHR
jgi:hypothetical protein